MHIYRTHHCGELRKSHVGQTVRLSGWVHRKRDHGNLLFVDLRDHHGVTQCVIDTSSPIFASLESARPECVVTVTGPVVARSPETATTGSASTTRRNRIGMGLADCTTGPSDFASGRSPMRSTMS